MKYMKSKNVISFGNLKQAALFFDKVLPVKFIEGMGWDWIKPEKVPYEVIQHLVFGGLKNEKKFSLYTRWSTAWEEYILKSLGGDNLGKVFESSEQYYQAMQQLYLYNGRLKNGQPIRLHFADFASRLGIDHASVLIEENKENIFINDDPYLSLCMLDIPIVNVEKASWDQILELRRDEESRNRLRRLRLFFFENYKNRDKDYLEDDLQQRLYEFELTRKKHGFSLITGSLEVLLDARNLQAALSSGLFATLLGGPITGLSTAALIEVGKIALKISKTRKGLKDLEQGHELAFIINAKKRID
jgi:hypothetical protein